MGLRELICRDRAGSPIVPVPTDLLTSLTLAFSYGFRA